MNQNFQNPQIFNFEIPDFSDLKLTAVSPKYLTIILLNITLLSVVAIGALAVVYFFYFNLTQIQVVAIAVGVSALVTLLYLNTVIGFKFRKYAIREHDLVYQYGWLKRTVVIIPFNRIQHIKVEQGWLSKILRLKSVSVFTAGVSGGDLTVSGLPEDIAEGINSHIRRSISSEKKEDGGENT